MYRERLRGRGRSTSGTVSGDSGGSGLWRRGGRSSDVGSSGISLQGAIGVGVWWSEDDGVQQLLGFLDLVERRDSGLQLLDLFGQTGAADTAGWRGERSHS